MAETNAPPHRSLPNIDLPARTALVVVDVQTGFDDPRWGPRDNPDCEENIAALLAGFHDEGRPVVLVRHDSTDPQSPLHPSSPGNAFEPFVRDTPHDLLVVKSVNSAFLGAPDLDEWLRERHIDALVIAGVSTNHCCETTARMGGNLGYEVFFVLDATHTFDRRGPDGEVVSAAELARVTAVNLHGEFASVVSTRAVLSALTSRRG